VIKEHLDPGRAYALGDFVARCERALEIASDRVRAKYGFPCSIARAERVEIRRRAEAYEDREGAEVKVIAFIE